MKPKKVKRKPKNGQYFVGLLVGGSRTEIDQYETLLAQYGVMLEYTWTQIQRQLPQDDVELVFMIRDNRIPRKARDDFETIMRSRGAFVIDATKPSEVRRLLDRERFITTPLDLAAWAETETPEPVATPEPEPVAAPKPMLVTPPEPVVITAAPEPEPVPKKPMSPKEAGELLKLTRMNTGYSADKLGKMAGCSSSHIYQIELGKPTSETTGTNIEKILELAPGTLPRHLAPSPVTHRPLSLPPVPRALPPTPAPAPKVTPPPPSPSLATTSSLVSPRERLYLELLDLKSRLKAQGIKSIVLRPDYLEVVDEAQTRLS